MVNSDSCGSVHVVMGCECQEQIKMGEINNVK